MAHSIFDKNYSGLKHMVLVGAPFVGKGQSVRKISTVYSTSVFAISTGQIVRQRFVTDREFSGRYKDSSDAGGLIPGPVIAQMACKKMIEGVRAGFTNFLWDGFPRSILQLNMMRAWIKIGDELEIIILHAGSETINERHNNALKEGHRTDRSDNLSYGDRVSNFNLFLPQLLTVIARDEIAHKHLDANGTLENVTENVLREAGSFFNLSYRASNNIPIQAVA